MLIQKKKGIHKDKNTAPLAGGVRLAGGQVIVADDVVIAAGNGAPVLARDAGDHGIIQQAAKGYVIDAPTAPGMPALRNNVVDDDAKVYAAPLPSPDGTTRVRLSGLVEFGGHAGEFDPARARQLIAQCRAVFPEGYLLCGDDAPADGATWHTCCRPQTPDDLPFVGPSPSVQNLWYNAGHGHLGWSRGAGSADVLTAMMYKREPAVDPAPFSPNRFSPRWRADPEWHEVPRIVGSGVRAQTSPTPGDYVMLVVNEIQDLLMFPFRCLQGGPGVARAQYSDKSHGTSRPAFGEGPAGVG